VIAVQQLDVHVLIERAGQPITGRRDDTPSPAVIGRERYGSIVRRITQTEQREFLEGTIEDHSSDSGRRRAARVIRD
jgi:hypothetical protein